MGRTPVWRRTTPAVSAWLSKPSHRQRQALYAKALRGKVDVTTAVKAGTYIVPLPLNPPVAIRAQVRATAKAVAGDVQKVRVTTSTPDGTDVVKGALEVIE